MSCNYYRFLFRSYYIKLIVVLVLTIILLWLVIYLQEQLFGTTNPNSFTFGFPLRPKIMSSFLLRPTQQRTPIIVSVLATHSQCRLLYWDYLHRVRRGFTLNVSLIAL